MFSVCLTQGAPRCNLLWTRRCSLCVNFFLAQCSPRAEGFYVHHTKKISCRYALFLIIYSSMHLIGPQPAAAASSTRSIAEEGSQAVVLTILSSRSITGCSSMA